MPYQLRTFGGLILLGPDGGQMDAVRAHSKGAGVLAYLATRPAGEPVDRGELLPLLWPERTEEEGRNSLRAVLSRLRGHLPEGALGGKGEDRLWLEGSVLTSDVRRFMRAEQEGRLRDAVELYRGPFLEHFHLSDAGPFNRWVDERRTDYRRRAYEAAVSVAEDARAADDLAEAEGAYRRSLELAPLKEEAAAGLLRVLAARGERTDALQFYQAFRERLEEELDLSPSGELEALAERIRSRPAETAGPPRSREKPTGAGSPSEADEGRDPAWRVTPGRLLAALLAVGLAGAGLWFGLGPGGAVPEGGTETAVAGREAKPTVAVLPFENLSGTGEATPFLRGLHSDLLTRLESVDGIAVLSRSSVLPYREPVQSLSAIADTLRAEWILEGGVQTAGDRVQVHAQLINPNTGTHAWAKSYRRELTAENLFEIQGDLTRRIVEALEVELTRVEERRVASVPTENTAAYELYLQAKKIEEEAALSEESNARKIRLYRRALELDSAFAEAWAGLADGFVDRAWKRGGVPAWADSGRSAAERALALDPELAHAHVQLGDALSVPGDEEGQLAAYRRALELQPGHEGAANNLLAELATRGQFAEALKWLDRLRRTSPNSPVYVASLLGTNVLLGRDSVAEAWRSYARERDLSLTEAEFRLSLFLRADLDRARTLLRSLSAGEMTLEDTRRRAALALYEGNWERARGLYRRLYSKASEGPGLGWLVDGLLAGRLGLAWTLDRLGRREEARKIAREVRKDARGKIERGRGSFTLRRRLSVAALILGDTAKALDWLERAVELGDRARPVLERVPTLAPVRDHPRFRDLLGRVDDLLAEERRRAEEEGWGEPPAPSPAG